MLTNQVDIFLPYLFRDEVTRGKLIFVRGDTNILGRSKTEEINEESIRTVFNA